MADKQVSDAWERGSLYEQYVGRWSRHIAPKFLSWLAIRAGRRWLDVGCGTGALCASILDRCSPSLVAGVEPSEGFLNAAKENLAGRAVLHRGSASAIPLDDASVDVAVSGLVLNFVPDQGAALLEMARVTVDRGHDRRIRLGLRREDGAHAVLLGCRGRARPGRREAGRRRQIPAVPPEALEALFAGAGLKGVEVKAIDIPTSFANFDDYWLPFLGGQGPAPAYATSLDGAARVRLREHIRDRLPIAANGSISLTARAWAARASLAR